MDPNILIAGVSIVALVLSLIMNRSKRKNDKIKAIKEKLNDFYYPLKNEILKRKKDPLKENTKITVSHTDFINRIYLCQNKHVQFVLKKFKDPQSNVGIDDLIGIEEFVEMDINKLEKELNKLLS